jgi:hypothetical protein
MSRTREIPFVQAEYFEPGPEELTYLPLRKKDGEISKFPLPPLPYGRVDDLKIQIEDLNTRLWNLEEKIAAAKSALS